MYINLQDCVPKFKLAQYDMCGSYACSARTMQSGGGILTSI